MRLSKDQAIEKAFNYANLNTEDDDIIYKAIYKYKILSSLDEKEIDEIYDYIAERLGFLSQD